MPDIHCGYLRYVTWPTEAAGAFAAAYAFVRQVMFNSEKFWKYQIDLLAFVALAFNARTASVILM